MPQQTEPLLSGLAATALALAIALGASGCQNAGDTDSLVADAKQYRQRGENKAAVIQLKNAIQKDPDHRAARIALGEVYVEQGDAVSADKELRRAQALGASPAEVLPLLGKAMLMQGQFDRVLDEIKPDGNPKQRAVLLALRANAALGLGNSEPAKDMFDQALKLDPGYAEALLGLARLAMAQRQSEQAIALTERALAANPGNVDCLRFLGDILRLQGKSEPALAAYRQILSRHPDNAQAHVDIANLHIDAGRFADARSEIAAARKLSPGALSVFYSRAMVDFRERKNAAALESLQQILRAAPDHMPSVLLIGAVHLALGSPEQAEQFLKRFLSAYPRHAYATKLMASANLRSGNPEAALALLSPLIRELPDDVELLAMAGEANMRAGHFSGAADYFERASSLQPNAALLHTALGLSRLGTGDNARAVAELERAAVLDTSSARAGVLLIMTYLRSNATDKALAAIEAMGKQADNPVVQNLKGGVYLARHDAVRARASFDKALAKDPVYLPALDNLAQLDLLEKRPEQAKARFEAALAKAPKNAALMDALARLASAQGKAADAMAWLERAHRENPDAIKPALRLVDFYLRTGEKRKAADLAQKLQLANTSNAEVLAAFALAQYANQDYAAALESYAKLAVLLPNTAAVHTRTATVQLAMRDEAGALASLRKALSIAPDMIEAQTTQAAILLAQKEFNEADTLAAAMQKQHPDSPLGYKIAADVQLAQERPLQAAALYERAFSHNKVGPLLIQIHNALSRAGKGAEAQARMTAWLKEHPADVPTRLYFASSKLARNETAAAIEQFEAVLERDPKHVVALNDLAWAYQRVGDKRALALAERAYQLAGDNAAVMDTLGWIEHERGNTARALPLLQKASALAPNAGEIRYHLGMALAKSGDKRNARKELERLLASNKDFPKREEVKALLAAL